LTRDLGVTVDSNFKFDQHVSLIVRKALVRSRLILKFFHSRDRLFLVKAFCTYVRPLLEYFCVFWSPSYHYLTDKIEGVQRFFTKRLAELQMNHIMFVIFKFRISRIPTVSLRPCFVLQNTS
jgi:hypothetical protein